MDPTAAANVLPEHTDLQAGATHTLYFNLFCFFSWACLLIAFKTQANTSATPRPKKATKMLFLERDMYDVEKHETNICDGRMYKWLSIRRLQVVAGLFF